MQGKSLYHNIYLARVTGAIEACQLVASLDHSGEKGRIREILIRSLFQPLFPADLGVGTGFIITADGQVSTQQDIILYDRATLPPALVDDTTGFFPIESALYTIEIKSKLTVGELSKTHDVFKKLASFQLLDGRGKLNGQGPRPINAIYALSTDLQQKGKSELRRYQEVRGEDPPFVHAICVVGRGYWHLKDEEYHEWPETSRHAETIAFIGGILK